jgi:hypothetical protein
VLDLAERSGARNSIDLCTGEFGTLSGTAGGPGENAPGESNGVWILTGVR